MTNEELDKLEAQLDKLEERAVQHSDNLVDMINLLENLVKYQRSVARALVTVGVTGFVCLAVTYIAAAFAIFWG